MKNKHIFICIVISIFLIGCSNHQTSLEAANVSQPEVDTSDVVQLTPKEKYEEIVNKHYKDWTLEDINTLFSVSNVDLGVNLRDRVGGRNVLFNVIGSSVHFNYGYLDFFVVENDGTFYPDTITISRKDDGTLELGIPFSDIMDCMGETEIHSIVRAGGGSKGNIPYLSYLVDGIVFIFEGELFDETPPDDASKIQVINLHIMKSDNILFERYTDVVF